MIRANRFSKATRAQQETLNLIARGEVGPDGRLPPETALADMIGVSVITVRRALAELAACNIIERFQGRGTFVKRSPAPMATLGTIAFVLVDCSTVINEGLIEAARRAVTRRMHSLKVVTCADLPSADLTAKLAGVTGVLLTGRIRDEWFDFLDMMHVPYVVAGTQEGTREVWMVKQDAAAAAQLLTERLFERGCRRIALINAATRYRPSHEIHSGYVAALAGLQLPLVPSRVVWCSLERRHQELMGFLAASRCDFDGAVVEQGCFYPLLVSLHEYDGDGIRPILGVLTSLRLVPDAATRFEQVVFEPEIGERAVDLLFEATAAGNRQKPKTIDLQPKLVAVAAAPGEGSVLPHPLSSDVMTCADVTDECFKEK